MFNDARRTVCFVYGITLLLVLAIVVLSGGLTSAPRAGLNAGAKVAIHVVPHASRGCIKSFPSITGCDDIITSLADFDADCFPVFYDLVSYQALDYGLTWPGASSCQFTSCSDLTIGNIINPGDGVAHAWTTCQTRTVAIPGWAWIYDQGIVALIDNPQTEIISVADCSGGLDTPVHNFYAGIGGVGGGADPCSLLWSCGPFGDATGPVVNPADSTWILEEETSPRHDIGFVSRCSSNDAGGSSIDLSFRTANSTYLALEVFDVHGRAVRQLAAGYVAAGTYSVLWNAADDNGIRVSPGVYFAHIRTSTMSVTRKVILVD